MQQNIAIDLCLDIITIVTKQIQHKQLPSYSQLYIAIAIYSFAYAGKFTVLGTYNQLSTIVNCIPIAIQLSHGEVIDNIANTCRRSYIATSQAATYSTQLYSYSYGEYFAYVGTYRLQDLTYSFKQVANFLQFPVLAQ